RVRQPLGDDVVAEGNPVRGATPPFLRGFAGEAGTTRRQVLIRRPSERTVIDNEVVCGCRGDSILAPVTALRRAGLARTYADVPDDDIVSGDVDAAANDRYPGGWRGLAGNREERLGDAQRCALK